MKNSNMKKTALYCATTSLLALSAILISCKKDKKGEEEIKVTWVSLNQSSISLTVGEEFRMRATIEPYNAKNRNVIWSSSDTTIATVRNAGGEVRNEVYVSCVTAMAGSAIITATTEDGGISARCTVHVQQTPIGVILDRKTDTLPVGAIFTLTATVLPDSAITKKVIWTSTNPSVASVDKQGLVNTLAQGTTYIVAKTESGNKSDSCFLQIFEGLGEISFATDSVWIVSNSTITQIWSDVVQATGCEKTTFNGGEGLGPSKPFLADCRLSDRKGNLFSWLMVDQNKEELCPSPWRVPDTSDFRALHIILGGRADIPEHTRDFDTTVVNKYLSIWGGDWIYYWGLPEADSYCGYLLYLYKKDYFVVPMLNNIHKYDGAWLRCVRD